MSVDPGPRQSGSRSCCQSTSCSTAAAAPPSRTTLAEMMSPHSILQQHSPRSTPSRPPSRACRFRPPGWAARRRGSRASWTQAEHGLACLGHGDGEAHQGGGHIQLRQRSRTCCPCRRWRAAPCPAGPVKAPSRAAAGLPQPVRASSRSRSKYSWKVSRASSGVRAHGQPAWQGSPPPHRRRRGRGSTGKCRGYSRRLMAVASSVSPFDQRAAWPPWPPPGSAGTCRRRASAPWPRRCWSRTARTSPFWEQTSRRARFSLKASAQQTPFRQSGGTLMR